MAESLVGRRLPDDAILWILTKPEGSTQEGPSPVKLGEITRGRRVVLFAVPGPFTPGCTKAHAPGFISSAKELRAKGIEGVYCISAADVFVMKAWSDSIGNGGDESPAAITMLSDGNLELTEALGLVLDARAKGMGRRSKRYVMIVRDGVIEHCAVDEGKIEKTSARAVLSKL